MCILCGGSVCGGTGACTQVASSLGGYVQWGLLGGFALLNKKVRVRITRSLSHLGDTDIKEGNNLLQK